MTATIERKPWDFSPALALISALNAPPISLEPSNWSGCPLKELANGSGSECHTDVEATKDHTARPEALGDLSRIFKYLGAPLQAPAASAFFGATAQYPIGVSIPCKIDYASDGATYTPRPLSAKKTVQWTDQVHLQQDTATDEGVSDTSGPPDSPTAAKCERKKKTKKEKKKEKRQKKQEKQKNKALRRFDTVSESEADKAARPTPACRASSHIATGIPHKIDSRTKSVFASSSNHASAAGDGLLKSADAVVHRLEGAKTAERGARAKKTDVTSPKGDMRIRNEVNRLRSTLIRQNRSVTPTKDSPQRRHHGHLAQVSTLRADHIRMKPATVQPVKQAGSHSVIFSAPPPTSTPRCVKKSHSNIEAERHWTLLRKLMNDFDGDKKHLIAPMNLITHHNDPNGIHVFVDASNIFIGFAEQLRRSQNVPKNVTVPPTGLSFDALALLMERRRPIAKRVLVGSNPHLPAFDKAKAVGYECSILDRVFKARELTERQIYFKEIGHSRRRTAKAQAAKATPTLNGEPGGGNDTGLETIAPQYAPARLIEQGVDEILHLKMMESVVDAEQPGTMVLATGDAAQAEYSQGFMAMAERALKKGWSIELVSWSKNISMMYTKREWAGAWGQRFRVVYLDDYAAELTET